MNATEELQMIDSYEKREYCALAGHGFRIVAEAVEAKPEYRIPCPTLLLCGESDVAMKSAGSDRQKVLELMLLQMAANFGETKHRR